MIVENDHALRELMERYLSGEGFRVVSAASGKDLHMLVQAHRPALIVLDMELPELASADAIGQIASPWFPRGIPVILLGSPSQMQEARALGAVDYLTKPLNWPMLAAVSKKWARTGAHLGLARSPGGRVVAGKPGA